MKIHDVYSFSSRLFSDASNFSMPFRVSISLSVVGGILYAIAPAFASSKSGLVSLALGRILGGFGKAVSFTFFDISLAVGCSNNDNNPGLVVT